MTEFIPNPKQARQDLINQHALDLIFTMHERLKIVEKVFDVCPKRAHQCQEVILKIQDQEKRIKAHPQNKGAQNTNAEPRAGLRNYQSQMQPQPKSPT